MLPGGALRRRDGLVEIGVHGELLACIERGERDFAFALLSVSNRAFACAVLMHDLWLLFVPASPLSQPGTGDLVLARHLRLEVSQRAGVFRLRAL
ncbi:MAG: hypothetical protein ACRDP8_19800 [Actinopolymorphaceae bacterium]